MPFMSDISTSPQKRNVSFFIPLNLTPQGITLQGSSSCFVRNKKGSDCMKENPYQRKAFSLYAISVISNFNQVQSLFSSLQVAVIFEGTFIPSKNE